TSIDAQLVLPENLATSRFEGDECFQPKAVATAARRRAAGAVARAIHGDVRYVLRPGLVRALAALLVAVDNQAAVRDVVEMVWDAGITGMPLFVLTCGNAGTGGGYQVRV